VNYIANAKNSFRISRKTRFLLISFDFFVSREENLVAPSQLGGFMGEYGPVSFRELFPGEFITRRFGCGRRLRFEKSRFPGPFRQKLLSYSEITLTVFRTLPVAPGCNKVPEKEKTSGNHYIPIILSFRVLWRHSTRGMLVLGATDLAVPGQCRCHVQTQHLPERAQWHPSHESPLQSQSVISFENCHSIQRRIHFGAVDQAVSKRTVRVRT
jgi:hypothetical protein